MCAELVAEAVDVARDRHRGGVAERAQALAEDAVADVEQQLEVGLRRVPVLDPVQKLHHPARPLAARRALPARLVLVELGDAQAELHHAGAVVDHDHRAGAEHRAGPGDRVEIEARVELVGREHRHRRAARNDRLQLPPTRDAAAEVVDQLAQRRAERHLVVAAPDDVSREGEDARAGGVRNAELRVLGTAQLDDLRDGRDRLDVVDQRRRRIEPLHGRERRLRARLAALALERLEQPGLLTADVGTGTAVENHRRVSQQPLAARLVQRAPQDLELRQVLASDVDEDVLRLDGVGGDQAALDEAVWDREHDLAVLERARLGLVGVDDEIGRLPGALGEEARLAPHREASAAAATDLCGEQLVQHLLGLEAARPLEHRVAADRAVLTDPGEVAPLFGPGEDDPAALVSHCAAPR